jgi:ubiquinone/menaquinone biosynthesis C-methylase UbiE
MFASIAGRYDLLNHLLSLNIDRRWRRFTTRVVPASPGVPVLDCCTGTADLALAYAISAVRCSNADWSRFAEPELGDGSI